MNSKFYENLKDNLIERYNEFSGQKIDSIFFEIKVTDFKKKRVVINNNSGLKKVGSNKVR
jgi:CRISPR/Cas system endoribonuclease Cas6 (RAMP superfamily)